MKLTIVEGGTRTQLTFQRPIVRLGRALDNDVRLNDTLVSRHHCQVEVGGGRAWVEDLGSSNGTTVNGNRIRRHALAVGDRIQLGAVKVELEPDEDWGIESRPEETQEITPEHDGFPSADLASVGSGTISDAAEDDLRSLRVYAQIARELNRPTELEPLLRMIVDSGVILVGAERGFLLFGDERGGTGVADQVEQSEVRVARNFDRSDIVSPRSRLSTGIARRVLESGRAVLAVDASRDERFHEMKSVEDLALRSVLCVPVRIDGKVEGALYLDNRLQEEAFTDADLELVQLLAEQAGTALRNGRMLSEMRERNQRLLHSREEIRRLNEKLGRKVRDQGSELAVVRKELGRERGRFDYGEIVGASDSMSKVFQQLDRIIGSELPVLVHGESGTGKELIARAVHFNGARKDQPFVAENCAALPDTLLESELFGHAKGSFTGAHRDKKGLFEQADGGTLFLDEVGDMSPDMQKKLLRALQEGEFRVLGSDERVKVNVRLIAASHRDLEGMVAEGAFREDLFYRINVLAVHLPPLRERREDIPLLAEHLMTRASREANQEAPHLPHEVIAALTSYDWPGNVRELENEMRRLVVLARDRATLDLLSPRILQAPATRLTKHLLDPNGEPADIKTAVADLEKNSIEAALAASGGNKSLASKQLGISRFALQRKLDKYGIGATKRRRARPGAASQSGDPSATERESGASEGL